jgi:hypothetical protein
LLWQIKIRVLIRTKIKDQDHLKKARAASHHVRASKAVPLSGPAIADQRGILLQVVHKVHREVDRRVVLKADHLQVVLKVHREVDRRVVLKADHAALLLPRIQKTNKA